MEGKSNTFMGLKKVEDFSCDVIKTNQEDNEEKQCILNFKIRNHLEIEERKMTISKAGLDVLLDGLHKIQNQLSNVASKNKSQ